MKVLHVIDGLGVGGGAEESLVGMLPLLRDRDIDSSVICLYGRDGHEEHLREQGFQVTVLNARGVIGAALGIRRAVQRVNPDVVHATLIDATFATRLACLGLKPLQLNSLVNTTYDPQRTKGSGIAPWKLGSLRFMDRVSSRWVDAFHVITEAVADEAVSVLKIPRGKLILVPRGRDRAQMGRPTAERRARVRAELGVSTETPVVLNVGRHSPQKGKLDLVEAFNTLLTQIPDAVLLIAGRDGGTTVQLHEAVARSAAPNQMRILGQRSDVPDLLAAADLFAFPSFAEGLGGALIEAMAMGCPIVGSDAPAVTEVLGHGQYGKVVPRGDVRRLTRAMGELLNDNDERDRLSKAGLRRFADTYELDHVIDSMAAMYRQLIQAASERSRPRTLERLVTKAKRLAQLPLVNIEMYGFPSHQSASAATAELPELRRAHDPATFERIYQADIGLTGFAGQRLAQGCSFWALTSGDGGILSSMWVSAPGAKANILEIGRSLRLRPDQRVSFDLQTPPPHRGLGYATRLRRAVLAEYPESFLAWVRSDNAASIRVMEHCGGVHLGHYALASASLRFLPERLESLDRSRSEPASSR